MLAPRTRGVKQMDVSGRSGVGLDTGD